MKQRSYSNFNATLALAKASLTSIFRSPSAVIFTLVFPLIFILVFGFVGSGPIRLNIGIDARSDMDNPVIDSLIKTDVVKIQEKKDKKFYLDLLRKGKIDALIKVNKNPDGNPKFLVEVTYTSASKGNGDIFKSILTSLLYKLNLAESTPKIVDVAENHVEGRLHRSIDFILPGQLGFSLLSTGVFGTAFVFFSLRQNLVIKRFFATPVHRSSIILGECIARIGFALIGALFIILVGHFLFHFTLVSGVKTVINMLLMSFFGVVVFMGFGFIISGLAKNESMIPPISNIITLPQFLLSGTFFSVDAFPAWLQPISKALPLTHLNEAMRLVAFEGAGLWDVRTQLLILSAWGVAAYLIAIKTFKWE